MRNLSPLLTQAQLIGAIDKLSLEAYLRLLCLPFNFKHSARESNKVLHVSVSLPMMQQKLCLVSGMGNLNLAEYMDVAPFLRRTHGVTSNTEPVAWFINNPHSQANARSSP